LLGGVSLPFQLLDSSNRNTALASALVEELARCGVRHAVVAPGSRSTPLAVALWRQPAIEVSVVVDERCAGFLALGAAQASGAPVAVLCTSGSAAANLHPAVVEADEAGVPMIVLTADRPPELRGIGAGQTIDQIKLYGSAVRWFCEVGTHAADDDGLLHHRSVACRAYATARGEPRPGPVHLNVAWREPLAPVPVEGDVTATSSLALEGRGDRPLTAVAGAVSSLEPPLLDELAERIAASPHGLILAGRQTDPALAAPVASFARTAGYPILAEPTSQLRCGPHDRDLVVWPYDALARAAHDRLAPDLVVRFGDMPTSKSLRRWIASLEGLRQIVVDPAAGWNEPSRRAETIVRADRVAVARGLTERLGPAIADWSALWVAASRAAAESIASSLSEIGALTEPGVHHALADSYADGELVYTASSMPIRDQEAFLPSVAADVRFLCNRGANGIDGLVSSGAGAATASGRPTNVLLGDLALHHDINGLAAVREASAPLRFVVLDNGGGGIFDFLPQAEAMAGDEFEALMNTRVELDLSRVASLYGLEHRRIASLDELAEALGAGTGLIEVPVDRARNVELHRDLTAAAASAAEQTLSRA
jgi:2-succinyl-5-enolpyruvyl-6-hydroxy-3-cyclohexene-1-carboxylate synthase